MDWFRFNKNRGSLPKVSDPAKLETETVIRLTRELASAHASINAMHRRAQQAEAEVLALRKLSEWMEQMVAETVAAASQGYEAMLRPHREVKEMCGRKLRDARAASRLYQKVFERVSFLHSAFKAGDQVLFEEGVELLISEVDRFHEEIK